MKLDSLIESIKALPAIDFARLKNLILCGDFDSEKSIEDFLISKRFENGEACPICGDSRIVRNGHRKDTIYLHSLKTSNNSSQYT